MAEFWPEMTESSSAKMVNSSSNANMPVVTPPSDGDDAPTVLSTSRAPANPAEGLLHGARELAGEMLAHFRLDDYVGVGGMGAVFRATDLRLDRPVALKILPPEQAKDPEVTARFQREARAAARLDHENIARVYFVGEDRGLHFIAFEYVEGVNVRELIAQCGSLPAHEVVNYAIQITGALVHATSRGVVHRDIKPSNIIITLSGRAKLVDMGLARSFERRHDGGLTQSNITLGTFDYIAPEQARDPRSADIRSDIYSLGCTLFHMLTGRPPYPEGTVLQKLIKHQEETPPNLRAMNPLIPDHLASLVQRMMGKDPARRHQTPQELLRELLEIAADMGLKSSSPEGLIWWSDQPRTATTKLTWAIWLTAAAALVIGVIRLQGPLAKSPVINPGAAIPAHRQDVAIVQPPLGPHEPPNALSGETVGARAEAQGSSDETKAPPATAGANNQVGSAAPPELSEPVVLVVGQHQDLRTAINEAPSGAVIELTGDHRPQITHKVDDTAGIRIEGKRLTIRAAPGSRPRIMLAYDAQAFGVADWNLFSLVNAQLELEGIHFEMSGIEAPVTHLAMLSCQSSQVLLRRCSFIQAGAMIDELVPREGMAGAWVAHLDGGLLVDEPITLSRLVAIECWFGGGDGAFYLDGPARTEFTDCVVLPYRTTFFIRTAGFPPSLAADVRLNQVSLFGSGAPVFDLASARVTVNSHNVIYSHEAPVGGILARVDAESRLDWKGQRNVYHGLRQYLVARSGSDQQALAKRLSDWLELSREVDEQESNETENSPWLVTLSEAAKMAMRNSHDPSIADAFRIARAMDDSNGQQPGARFVLPWGPLYQSEQADLTAIRMRQFARSHSTATTSPSESTRGPGTAEPREKVARSESAPVVRGNSEAPNVPGAKLDIKKIMNTLPTNDAASDAESTGSVPRPASDAPAPTSHRDALVVDPLNSSGFVTLAAACERANDGSVIEIRHSGRMREGPIDLGDRHLTIRAAVGFRPTIEFATSQFDLRGREPRLFDIRRGSLTIKDLDLHMIVDPAVSMEPWAAITSRSADVQLDGCTVTAQSAAGLTTSVVRFLSGDIDDPMAVPGNELPIGRPQLQLRNSLSAGLTQLVRVQPAVRVRVEIENCALDVQETLLSVSGGMERGGTGAFNELEIRHATIRTRSGLVRYEASEARAWLPRLEVTASDNIFAGEGDAPWIRFRSPRGSDELRGLLRWRGMNNSYAGVSYFWRIESPNGADWELLTWDQWTRSPAREEIRGDRGPIEFAAASEHAHPWQRSRHHFRPLPSPVTSEMASDGGSRGADLNLIPAPPFERETEPSRTP